MPTRNLSLEKALDDEALQVIRATLIQIKEHKEHKEREEHKERKKYPWKRFALDIDAKNGSENVLNKFVSEKNNIPRIIHLRKYIQFIEKFYAENPELPIFGLYKDLKIELFGSTDLYLPFKQMLGISQDEQFNLAAAASGDFIALRRSADGRFVVSHVHVINTYKSKGLPICRIVRKRNDDYGDVTIEASVWKKNQHVYILGYEVTSGHIRTMQLTPTDSDLNLLIGMTSGHDSTGASFSARIHLYRTIKRFMYAKCRDITGYHEDEKSVAKNIFDDEYLKRSLAQSMKSLGSDTYTSIAPE